MLHITVIFVLVTTAVQENGSHKNPGISTYIPGHKLLTYKLFSSYLAELDEN